MTKEEIMAELKGSREALVQGCAAIGAELDLKAKLNNLVRQKPYAWLSGAAAVGWFLAGPKTKTRVVKQIGGPNNAAAVQVKKKTLRAGLLALLVGLVRFVIPVVRPALSAYAGRRLADIAVRRKK
jgi:hypothetical protein